MNTFLEQILLNIIFIIAPFYSYLMYECYSESLDKDKKELMFDISLISSAYLILRFNKENIIMHLMLHVLIFLAILKRRKLGFIILIVIEFLNYYFNNLLTGVNLLQHVILILFFIISFNSFNKKKLYFIVSIDFLIFFIDGIFIHSEKYVLLFLVIIFLLLFYLFDLIDKSEETVKLYNNLKKIQDEKKVQGSLFKITHEIKNPIAVCKGYLDMMDIDNKEQMKRYYPIIKEEIDRVLILLQDFLSISRIKLDYDILDVVMLIEDVEKKLKFLLKEKNISLINGVVDDEIYIDGDYNRLSQVLINIIKNSTESISKEKKWIKISLKPSSSSVKIIIEDNGDGISRENLEKMKEPFFTTKKNGTGLGVYLSREIIQAHNGTINYKSQCNKGTKVTISLPKKKDINS